MAESVPETRTTLTDANAASTMLAGGALALDASRNPGVLDTATWNAAEAWSAIAQAGTQWSQVQAAVIKHRPVPALCGITVAPGACVRQGRNVLSVVRLVDGQHAIVHIGHRTDAAPMSQPLGRLQLSDHVVLRAYAADALAIDALAQQFPEITAPRALGTIPRLGIGVRMTTAVWPGIFQAMDACGCATNPIQNSVRELNLLEDLVQGRPAPRNYACGFGTIDSGYTGSTFEGLWLSGVLAAMDHPHALRFGADADHLQVKRDDVGLVRLRRTLAAARSYTFFTVDVSDVLDYAALDAASGDHAPTDMMPVSIELMHYHRDPVVIAGRRYCSTEGAVARYARKYGAALDALATISAMIHDLQGGRAFDLELSIDEHPSEIAAFSCLTGCEEYLFVLREIRRRGLRVSHIAPNLGIEKGLDYRHPSGLDGLRERTRTLFDLSEAFGVLIDVHSADDLSVPVREVLRQATGGRLHYKISPSLQLLFAEVLSHHHPELFARWWDDAYAYAVRESDAGSTLARAHLALPRIGRDVTDPLFHDYSFAFVGRRSAQGRFLQREEFYSLSPRFLRDYTAAVAHRIAGLASEIF